MACRAWWSVDVVRCLHVDHVGALLRLVVFSLGGLIMVKSEKSNGQMLVERIEKWLGGYMVLPSDYALVLSLWALMTWVFEKFDVIPYVVVTAPVKGAGKTQLAELVARLSYDPVEWGSATPATMYRRLGEKGGRMSLFIDEAESLGSETTGALRSVLNVGFRRGGKVARTGAGGKVEEFPAFCPKMIVLIGHVFDTLNDRSIVLSLERGTPSELARLKDYDMGVVDGEAAAIVGDPRGAAAGTIRRIMVDEAPAIMAVRPGFLSGRDRDIWSSLFGLAASLKLDDPTIDRLTRAAADLSKAKKAPQRVRGESESVALDAANAEQLLRDMRRIFREGEKVIFSAVAVERLKALPDGGWSKYRGEGLDVMSLASLLKRHGVARRPVRLARSTPGVKSMVANGYRAADVVAASERLGSVEG